jgi:16S rRNA (uracil1498-N3)-methyltransferase
MRLKCGMAEELTEAGGRTRLYVTVDLAPNATVPASEGQAHYLLHVMRAKVGGRLRLFNGRDGEWLAEIAQAAKRGVGFTCIARTAPQSEVPDIWLAFAPVKKTPADYLVQKATELGAAALLPVFTRRTIVTRVNEERLAANAIEAAEQSDRLSVPDIRSPVSLDKLLASWPPERRIFFCDEGGDAKPLAQALADFPPPLVGGGAARSDAGEGETPSSKMSADFDSPLPQSSFAARKPLAPSRRGRGELAAILTGPEGGFEPREREVLRALPFVTPVTLGPRILRADTAALAALAVWQSVKGDWR